MDKALFKEYLENRYKDQLNYYNSAAMKNQKKYKQFQWILIILSAITPILAALDGKWPDVHFQIPVVIISASVAILTAGLKTFQYQELWITYRATNELLKPEFYYYEFGVGPYAEEGIDKETLFVSRVEAMLDKEHTSWPAAKKKSIEEAANIPEEKKEPTV
jgi:hypothetical protein